MLIMNVSRDSRSLLFPVYSPLRVRKSNWRRYLGKNVLSRQKKGLSPASRERLFFPFFLPNGNLCSSTVWVYGCRRTTYRGGGGGLKMDP